MILAGDMEGACQDVVAAMQWLNSLGGRQSSELCPLVASAAAAGARPLLQVWLLTEQAQLPTSPQYEALEY